MNKSEKQVSATESVEKSKDELIDELLAKAEQDTLDLMAFFNQRKNGDAETQK